MKPILNFIKIKKLAHSIERRFLKFPYLKTLKFCCKVLSELDVEQVFHSNEIELNAYRYLFETIDDVIQAGLENNSKFDDEWLFILLPSKFLQSHLLFINVFGLRLTRSARLKTHNDFNFEDYNVYSKSEKMKYIARFCFHSDSLIYADYGILVKKAPKELVPFLTSWFFQIYLSSPPHFLDRNSFENRKKAIDSFIDYHKNNFTHIPFHDLINRPGYLIAYCSLDSKNFFSALTKNLIFSNEIFQDYFEPDQIKKSHKTSLSDLKTGIILDHWFLKDSVIYRCMNPLFKNLRSEGTQAILLNYHRDKISLDQLPQEWQQKNIKIKAIGIKSLPEDLKKLKEVKHSLNLDFLFYPEIGLNLLTRTASLLRIAKVQATGYGHPATTGSPMIDYFVGGVLLENKPEQYSERLVLLPQLGVGTERPPAPTKPRQRPYDSDHLLILNLSSAPKLNYYLLKSWNAILEAANTHLAFELYPGASVSRITSQLHTMMKFFPKTKWLVHPPVPRMSIINRLEEADLYLDSFPFGGFNTLVEVLASGCPMVTLEGDSARNRFGAAMLRMLGLPEFLIAKTEEQYIQAALRLIQDQNLRLEIRAQLERERVLNALCHSDIAEHFAAAVEWMCQQVQTKTSKRFSPVLIEAGEKPKRLKF